MHKGHCRSCRFLFFSFTVCIHPILCLHPRIRSTLSLLEEHPSSYLGKPRVLSMPYGIASSPTFLLDFNRFQFEPYCVLYLGELLTSCKATHPWNELWIRLNAHRVSIIWTSVSILLRVFFRHKCPSRMFPRLTTAILNCLVRVHIYRLLFFRVSSCCVYTNAAVAR